MFSAVTGPEYPPSMPQTFDDIDPGRLRPHMRLQRMDEYGIYAQVLYPNLDFGFEDPHFIDLDQSCRSSARSAYNDFLADFAKCHDPDLPAAGGNGAVLGPRRGGQ